MAILFTGSDYARLRNNLGTGEGNWLNGYTSVKEGNFMLFWAMLPADDMEIIYEPPVLNPLETRDGGRFRMWWKIADAEDEAHSAPERYEFLIGPAYTGGDTYRELPIVECSWSGVDVADPMGSLDITGDSDVAPSLPDAKVGDLLVTFHALVFHRAEAGSYTPIRPSTMDFRTNGWGNFPLDESATADWHITIYEKSITADGATGVQNAALNAIVHGVSGAVLLNPPVTTGGAGRKSVLPPGDKFSYIKSMPT